MSTLQRVSDINLKFSQNIVPAVTPGTKVLGNVALTVREVVISAALSLAFTTGVGTSIPNIGKKAAAKLDVVRPLGFQNHRQQPKLPYRTQDSILQYEPFSTFSLTDNEYLPELHDNLHNNFPSIEKNQ